MQTFLPYPDYRESAAVLDNKRLGKQRVEAMQLVDAIMGSGNLQWRKHPCYRMWQKYPRALCYYGITVCIEWERRGFVDIVAPQLEAYDILFREDGFGLAQPLWLGNDNLHLSHQSALVQKLPEHYSDLFPSAPPFTDYYWPCG